MMSCACVSLGGVAGQLCLNRIPQRLIDDRHVLARMGFAPCGRSRLDRSGFLQHQIERNRGRMACRPRGRPDALVRNWLWIAAGVELVLHKPDRAEFGIAAKNEAHGFRLAVDDDQLAVLCPIPRAAGTPPIHIPFFFEAAILSRMRSPMTSRSNCANDKQNVEGQAPHRGCRVELLA